MKRILIMLTVLMSATGIQAQQTEAIELPLSLYNQTKWQAKETTVTLNSEEEELPAYELQGWQTYQGMSRQGTVYYVPSALNDRIILMLKDVNSGFVRLPALIDNKTDKTLVIHVRGRVILNCQGTVIRSVGDVSIFGEETDDEAEPTSTITLKGGRRGHAAVETAGDVYLQEVRLDMVGNDAPYGFICTDNRGKEEHILTMNHVVGQATAKTATVAGFQKISAGSLGASVKGIEPNWSLDDEYREPAERVVGDNLIIPVSVMGQSRFASNPMEELTLGRGVVKKGIPLSVNLRKGQIYWIPDEQSLFLHNVEIETDSDMPFIESTTGRELIIHLSGNNQVVCKGDGIVSQSDLILMGAQPEYSDNTLKLESDGDCIKVTDSHNLYAEYLTMNISGNQGIVSEGSSETQFTMKKCDLDIKGKTSGIQGFFDIVGIKCGTLYGYWQAPKPLQYDQKARTFMMGSQPFKELKFDCGSAYLIINTKEGPWLSSKAEKVLLRD